MARTGTTTERGYGTAHQAEKERLRPEVEAGEWACQEVVCEYGSRWIAPGMPWDLAHDREATAVEGYPVYRGPAHERCNRAEGARHRNRLRGQPPLVRTWSL